MKGEAGRSCSGSGGSCSDVGHIQFLDKNLLNGVAPPKTTTFAQSIAQDIKFGKLCSFA